MPLDLQIFSQVQPDRNLNVSSTTVLEFRSAEFLRELIRKNRNKPRPSLAVEVEPNEPPPYMPVSAFILDDEIIECKAVES